MLPIPPTDEWVGILVRMHYESANQAGHQVTLKSGAPYRPYPERFAYLQKIEKADLHCEIGLVFEVAALVGIPLFGAELSRLIREIDRTQTTLALLPKSIRKPDQDVDDDL